MQNINNSKGDLKSLKCLKIQIINFESFWWNLSSWSHGKCYMNEYYIALTI